MSLDYVTFEDALEGWLADVTGLRVFWEERARINEAHLRSWGLLNVLSENHLGIDDFRIEDASPPVAGAELATQVAGQRVVSVSVRIKSRSQKPDQTARHYLGIARSSLRDPIVRAEHFHPARIAVVSIAGLANLDFTEQRRRISLAAMDVMFGTVAERLGTETFIEKIEASSDWLDPSGASLPPSLQLDDAELP